MLMMNNITLFLLTPPMRKKENDANEQSTANAKIFLMPNTVMIASMQIRMQFVIIIFIISSLLRHS